MKLTYVGLGSLLIPKEVELVTRILFVVRLIFRWGIALCPKQSLHCEKAIIKCHGYVFTCCFLSIRKLQSHLFQTSKHLLFAVSLAQSGLGIERVNMGRYKVGSDTVHMR